MGIYAEYLDRKLDFPELVLLRKEQLNRISVLREHRDVFCLAMDPKKEPRLSRIEDSDLLPISDQLSNLDGRAIDIILETPGGSGEAAEDIVKLFRSKYDEVSFIVPGSAKSAGTIIVMSGDEILMEPSSRLGPIDAQMSWQGKVFSADAFLEGLRKIKKEVDATGSLNRAFVPILANVSPGEIQACENALKFAGALVSDWLVRYKFKNWTKHSSTGAPVTEEERKRRASEIGHALCDHNKWLSHARSIKMDDLRGIGLRVTNYSDFPELCDAIRRYHVLLQMTFEMTNIYKVFETPSSQIYRFIIPPGSQQVHGDKGAKAAIVEFTCPNCKEVTRIQAPFEEGLQLKPGCVPFPANDAFRCPRCGLESNLKNLRFEVESQSKKRILLRVRDD